MSETHAPMSWGPVEIRIDLDHLERIANDQLTRRGVPAHDVRVEGEGSAVRLSMAVEWQMLAGHVTVHLEDLRLAKRHFGCRVAAVRGPMGLPLPVDMIGSLAEKFGAGIVRYDRDVDVLLADLRRFLPADVEVTLAEVTVEGRTLRLQVDAGHVGASFLEDLLSRA